MEIVRCASAAAFLDATLAYRGAEPLRTNVLGSVATSAAAGEGRRGEQFWYVVHDDTGCVVGAAMRTAPFALSLGPMGTEAAAALAWAVAPIDDGVPSVAGYEAAVDSFLSAYAATGSEGSARGRGPVHRQILYTAGHVEVPDVAGTLRVAGLDELGLAERYYVAFSEEVDGVRYQPSDEDRAALLGTLRAGRLRWWWHAGAAVAMAAHSVPVRSPSGVVTRIGPVFTPTEHRRHGYAAALTGQLTGLLLAGGSAVMLFADAANATSNGVYRRLGYDALDELVRVPLVAARSTGR